MTKAKPIALQIASMSPALVMLLAKASSASIGFSVSIASTMPAVISTRRVS